MDVTLLACSIRKNVPSMSNENRKVNFLRGPGFEIKPPKVTID